MKIFSVVIKIWIDNLPCTRGRLDAALLGFEKNPKLAGVNILCLRDGVNGVALTNALKLFIKSNTQRTLHNLNILCLRDG